MLIIFSELSKELGYIFLTSQNAAVCVKKRQNGQIIINRLTIVVIAVCLPLITAKTIQTMKDARNG